MKQFAQCTAALALGLALAGQAMAQANPAPPYAASDVYKRQTWWC